MCVACIVVGGICGMCFKAFEMVLSLMDDIPTLPTTCMSWRILGMGSS